MTDAPNSTEPDDAGIEDDHGAALERAAEAIKEARDAEGEVAAHDDITTLDSSREGEYSEDPGGEGGHP